MVVVDFIMIALIAVTMLVMFFYDYPGNWRNRKLIYGVRNRGEFKDSPVSEDVDRIASANRKTALIIMIVILVLAVLTVFIPDEVIRITVWSMMVIPSLVIMMIPYAKGNREMKTLKRTIGIASGKGQTYTDLKSAGSVHALKIVNILIPNIIAVVFFIAALLSDLGVVKLQGIISGMGGSAPAGIAIMAGSFMSVGLIILPIAIIMDNIRNEVISEDSDVNMNYNRARKKAMADSMVQVTWINTAFIICAMALYLVIPAELITLILVGIYVLLVMGAVILMARKNIMIDRRYRKETTVAPDDDDNWILGQFYYNPDDRRLNVEKRMGIGGTINLAHPAGKVIAAVSILLLLGSFMAIGYMLMLGKSPMSVRIEDGNVICHHVIDTYKVPVSSISDVSLEDTSALKFYREYGVAMDPVFTGNYTVNGEHGCSMFINKNVGNCIRFISDGDVYYINCSSDEETNKVYEELT